VLGQTKINDSINKGIVANDKILESLSEKMDSFNSATKNQLRFNKMLETQLAQLAVGVPSYEQGRIPGKPEDPLESVKIVSTRYGKPSVHCNYGYLVDPTFITKKDDPSIPAITCEIGPHPFHNVFCDLGSSVNIMSKVIYENLLRCVLLPTFMRLQMLDQTIQFLEGVAKDILVKIQDEYAPVDFVILDMRANIDVPVILGQPFLNTVNAVIYVGSGQIHLQFAGKRIKCPFNGYKTNMQPKDTKPEEKPRNKSRRKYNKGKSAKKAKQKEEPAKQVEHFKKEWREKEMPAQSPSLRPTEASIE